MRITEAWFLSPPLKYKPALFASSCAFFSFPSLLGVMEVTENYRCLRKKKIRKSVIPKFKIRWGKFSRLKDSALPQLWHRLQVRCGSSLAWKIPHASGTTKKKKVNLLKQMNLKFSYP